VVFFVTFKPENFLKLANHFFKPKNHFQKSMMQDWRNTRQNGRGENLTGCSNLLGMFGLLTFKTDLPMER
jgi:hypothetical protein